MSWATVDNSNQVGSTKSCQPQTFHKANMAKRQSKSSDMSATARNTSSSCALLMGVRNHAHIMGRFGQILAIVQHEHTNLATVEHEHTNLAIVQHEHTNICQ
ncbi:hypothetical protein BsWGS_28032 [Bradybaena similaris]